MKQVVLLFCLLIGALSAKDFGERSISYPIHEEDARAFFQRAFQGAAEKYLTEVRKEILTPRALQGITPADTSRSFHVELAAPLAFPLIFFDGDDPRQVAWARSQKGLWILVKGSPLDLREQEELYFDQNGLYTSMLGIQHTPALATPQERRIFVEEIALP